jgi:hypothetical protein
MRRKPPAPKTGDSAGLNDAHGFFERIIALEHPRFIVQYKYKDRLTYIDKYLSALEEARR